MSADKRGHLVTTEARQRRPVRNRTPARQDAPKPRGEARDYDVTATLADGSSLVHRSRASSPTLALYLACHELVRREVDAVKVEVNGA